MDVRQFQLRFTDLRLEEGEVSLACPALAVAIEDFRDGQTRNTKKELVARFEVSERLEVICNGCGKTALEVEGRFDGDAVYDVLQTVILSRLHPGCAKELGARDLEQYEVARKELREELRKARVVRSNDRPS